MIKFRDFLHQEQMENVGRETKEINQIQHQKYLGIERPLISKCIFDSKYSVIKNQRNCRQMSSLHTICSNAEAEIPSIKQNLETHEKKKGFLSSSRYLSYDYFDPLSHGGLIPLMTHFF